jgi:16S rRNA (guanine(966)-N(2))-methyltransferase RsmD
MMRVIAGSLGGRRLKGTPPPGVRPTSDKLRETLFNVLASAVSGAVFLDGYAGLGGVGIEAISRGARLVYFVERSRKAAAMIRSNLEALDIRSGFRLLETDLSRALDLCRREGTVFDIAFLDPPYEREDAYAADLLAFGTLPLLQKNGILVVEHSKRFTPGAAAGFLRQYRSLTHGDNSLSFYRIEEA